MEPGPRKLPSWLPQPGAGLKPSHCGLQISPAPCKVLAGTTVHTLLQSQPLRILSPLPPRTGGEQELTGAQRLCSGSQAGARTARTGEVGAEQELIGSLETVFRFSGWSQNCQDWRGTGAHRQLGDCVQVLRLEPES